MKSILKFLMTGIGLLLIGIGVGAIVFSTQALDIVKTEVEKRAGEALGTEVSIAKVSFLMNERGVLIEGFRVENPPEFKERDAITCEKILLKPAWNTLFAKTIRFESITVEQVRIFLRHETSDGTNIGTLLRNIRSFTEKEDDVEKEVADEKPKTNDETEFNTMRDAMRRDIRADRLIFLSGSLKVSSNILPLPPIPLDINHFEVKNVNDGKPVPVGKLMGVIIRDILVQGVTLKGLLKPIEAILRVEVEGI